MSAYRGVRIADFSQGLAGPMAAMLLGDYEAEVVKIEPPGGDRFKDHPGYHAWNRNKQVLTLDLETPAGLAEAHKLIAGADVALFDHSPGGLEAFGLEADALTAQHPALIHAWMPPYGTRGAWSCLPPHHSLLTALCGLAFRQGAYADQPVHLILPMLWYGQAVLGASAIGAALLARARTGRGQAVIVSGLHGMSQVAGPVNVLAAPPLPRGQPLGAMPSYRLYECGDGQWFFLGTLFANFYRKVFEALDLTGRWDELALDPVTARDTLMAIFRSRPRAEWLEILQDHGVPCAPVGPREDWFSGEAVAQGGLRQVFQHPTLGEIAMPAPPARLGATPASIRALAEPIATPPLWPPRNLAARQGDAASPLAGIRVLDLGTVIAGAHASGVLANLGAEVIKIEPMEGDPFRSDGGQFLGFNRGKRGLGLDLKQPAARELFHDLARQADVVIDNYRMGVRARLGIDYAALKAINPRIISCSINAYGDRGARATLPGFDPLLQAEGGMMAGQGGDGEPVLHTVAVNDVATSAVVCSAVIAALNARERTGEGQEILTSLMAQSLTFQLAEVVAYAGRPANDVGGRDCLGPRALHRFYRCVDGWIAIACDRPDEAAKLGRALGLDLGDGTDAVTAPRDGSLAAQIAAALAISSSAAALDALLAVGVAAAPVVRGPAAFENEWLWENGVFERWTHPRLGDIVSVRSYADFSETPGGFRHPTPDRGEHSTDILADMGVPAGRIAELLATGAVFEPAHASLAVAKSARPGDGGVALATQ